jgi:hypothetical protein
MSFTDKDVVNALLRLSKTVPTTVRGTILRHPKMSIALKASWKKRKEQQAKIKAENIAKAASYLARASERMKVVWAKRNAMSN